MRTPPMTPVVMKRLLLITLIALGCAFGLAAQEAGKKEQAEPSMALRWANFAILVPALGYFIYKTLPQMLVGMTLPEVFRARNEEIQKGISEAQALKQDADKRAAAVDARVRMLGSEIDKFRSESKIEMQQEDERIRQETARQIARMEAQAQQEIESAGKLARRELKSYAAKLALDLAEQRVRTRLDANTENALVNGFLQDLQRQPGKEARG